MNRRKKSLSDFIDEHVSEASGFPPVPVELSSFTVRVPFETSEKLALLSRFFGKKKTPFASDILEVAIDQFWDEADLPDELQEEFFHSMIEAGYGSTFPGEIDNRQQNLFEDK